tara:strand:+ start:1526 stop:2056 length:531 start_codon:yes stop_codon:yes gene_type:complete
MKPQKCVEKNLCSSLDPKIIYTPKDEEELSNEIARWLEDDLGPSKGVIPNREVQINIGQKTDIFVNAVSLDKKTGNYGTLTVVIEVKGIWNDGLFTAMKTQLVDRYMKENKINRGLYLVGWYLSDKWDDSDSRKQRNKRITEKDLSTKLCEQAERLNKEIIGFGKVYHYVLDLSLS